VVGITDAHAVDSGYVTACAIVTDGAVKCWGDGERGQLGNGFLPFTATPLQQSAVPVDVVGLTGVTQLSVGFFGACAVASGSVWCWGLQADGGLGNGVPIGGPDVLQNMPIPQQVVGITEATSVAVGFDWACARLATGHVKCWGWGAEGSLGNGIDATNSTAYFSSVPVDVIGISDATTVSAGQLAACALVAGGAAKCWGGGPAQLGAYGLAATLSSTPVDVTGLTGALELSSGYDGSFVRVASGRLRAWGENTNGVLATGPNVPAPGENIVDVYGIP